MMFKRIALAVALVLFVLVLWWVVSTEKVMLDGQQTQIQNTQTAYTNLGGYQISEHGFVATQGDCRIEWQVVSAEGDGRRYLEVQRDCALSFDQQLAMHRELLKRIDMQTPLRDMQLIKWHGLCAQAEADWCLSLAQASLQSEAYQQALAADKAQQAMLMNHLFVRLAIETGVSAPLEKLLAEFALGLELRGVEQVQQQAVAVSPYAGQLAVGSKLVQDSVLIGAERAYFFIRVLN